MNTLKFSILAISIIFGVVHYVISDGQRDHGEECSLRSQIANFFRTNDSPEGCISAKGLMCRSHKCVCTDPSNIYEVPEPKDSGSSTVSDISSAASAASSFFKKLVNIGSTTTTTTPAPAPATTIIGGGKCVGRAGSPCFTQNSTCVKHAVCEGTPRICKCQGIYSSNAQGHCSKTASVVSQVIKNTVG